MNYFVQGDPPTKKKTEFELFCFIFVEVIKKFMGSVFLGHPVHIFVPFLCSLQQTLGLGLAFVFEKKKKEEKGRKL